MNDKKNSNNEDTAIGLVFDITTIVRDEIGYNENFASQIAEALVRGLRKKYGCQEIYIPAPNRSERDASIRKEFNGRNIDEVCKKFGLSSASVYRIVGRKE
ncbi:MAG: Mor transcription activator family protein [Methylophilaceae bacterium]